MGLGNRSLGVGVAYLLAHVKIQTVVPDVCDLEILEPGIQFEVKEAAAVASRVITYVCVEETEEVVSNQASHQSEKTEIHTVARYV